MMNFLASGQATTETCKVWPRVISEEGKLIVINAMDINYEHDMLVVEEIIVMLNHWDHLQASPIPSS
jgi:hypothetical protein